MISDIYFGQQQSSLRHTMPCPTFSKGKAAAVLLVIITFFITLSMVDWHSYLQHGAYNVPTVLSDNYAVWFTASMFLAGFAIALTLKLAYWDYKLGDYLFATITIATIMLIISSFEDVCFFFFGNKAFPADNTQWTWMFQHQVFPWLWWNTTAQLIWTISWIVGMVAFVFLMVRRMRSCGC